MGVGVPCTWVGARLPAGVSHSASGPFVSRVRWQRGLRPNPLRASLRRASISRDPFYDMLATRKRRIANRK